MDERYSFSLCGRYLAHLSLSGSIRIWETETNVLKQEFTPKLSTSSNPFIWLSVQSNVSEQQMNKSNKKNRQDSILVVGCSSQIVQYSIAKGEIISIEDEHNSNVGALAADLCTDLFSGSDNCIVRWDISKSRPKSKWKIKKGRPLSSMAISRNNEVLVTNRQSEILCWNVETQEITNTLNGHNSDVIMMDMLYSQSGGLYLFSAARNERVINLWNLGEGCAKPVSVFRLTETAKTLSCKATESGSVKLVAVTRGGSLHMFQHQLNGPITTPVKPSWSILVTSNKSDESSSETVLIPITSAKIYAKRLRICYGFSTFISFDYLDIKNTDSDLFLVRQDPRVTISKNKEENSSKVKDVKMEGNAEFINPAVIQRSMKREWDETLEEYHIPLENLIDNMNTSSKSKPMGDSMTLMLVQGLNSKDKKILKSIILESNKDKILHTVQRLPLQAVMQLLTYLTSLVQSPTWMSQTAADWLQTVVKVHASQFIADDNFGKVIAPLLGLVETRLGCIGPLCKLRGRLDLLLDRSGAGVNLQPVIEPLLCYQDQDSPLSNTPRVAQEDDNNEDDDDDEDNDDDSDNDEDDGDKWDWSDKDAMEVDEQLDSDDENGLDNVNGDSD